MHNSSLYPQKLLLDKIQKKNLLVYGICLLYTYFNKEEEREKKRNVNHFLLNPKSIHIKTWGHKFLRFWLTVLLQIEFLCAVLTGVSQYLHYASVYLCVFDLEVFFDTKPSAIRSGISVYLSISRDLKCFLSYWQENVVKFCRTMKLKIMNAVVS